MYSQLEHDMIRIYGISSCRTSSLRVERGAGRANKQAIPVAGPELSVTL